MNDVYHELRTLNLKNNITSKITSIYLQYILYITMKDAKYNKDLPWQVAIFKKKYAVKRCKSIAK